MANKGKQVKRGRKPLTRDERINILREKGLTYDEARKYARKDLYDKEIRHLRYIKNRNKVIKEQAIHGNYLCVAYKDVTETIDADYIYSYMQAALSNQISLEIEIKSIQDALNTNYSFGEIGTYKMAIVNNARQFFETANLQNYIKVYQGSGRSLPNLIHLINFMMSMLYEPWQKDMFIRDLIYNLRGLESYAADNNANKLEELFLK